MTLRELRDTLTTIIKDFPRSADYPVKMDLVEASGDPDQTDFDCVGSCEKVSLNYDRGSVWLCGTAEVA